LVQLPGLVAFGPGGDLFGQLDRRGAQEKEEFQNRTRSSYFFGTVWHRQSPLGGITVEMQGSRGGKTGEVSSGRLSRRRLAPALGFSGAPRRRPCVVLPFWGAPPPGPLAPEPPSFYPSRPIPLIVPWPAGGATDISMRI